MSYLQQAKSALNQDIYKESDGTDSAKTFLSDYATAKRFLNDFITGNKSIQEISADLSDKLSTPQVNPYRYSENRKY